MAIHLRPIELAAVETTAADTYAIFVGEDERPLWGLGGLLDWKLGTAISRQLQDQQVVGQPGESVLMPTYGKTPGARIFAFGVGPASLLTAERWAEHAWAAVEKLQLAKVNSLAIGLPEQPPVNISAPILIKALEPLSSIETFVFGPVREMEQAVPGLGQRQRK
jgi:hypothetical protein